MSWPKYRNVKISISGANPCGPILRYAREIQRGWDWDCHDVQIYIPLYRCVVRRCLMCFHVATRFELQLFGIWKVNVLGTAVLLQATMEPGCMKFMLTSWNFCLRVLKVQLQHCKQFAYSPEDNFHCANCQASLELGIRRFLHVSSWPQCEAGEAKISLISGNHPEDVFFGGNDFLGYRENQNFCSIQLELTLFKLPTVVAEALTKSMVKMSQAQCCSNHLQVAHSSTASHGVATSFDFGAIRILVFPPRNQRFTRLSSFHDPDLFKQETLVFTQEHVLCVKCKKWTKHLRYLHIWTVVFAMWFLCPP